MDRSHCSINTFFNNSEKSGNSRTTRRASLDFRDTDDALGEKKIKEINSTEQGTGDENSLRP